MPSTTGPGPPASPPDGRAAWRGWPRCWRDGNRPTRDPGWPGTDRDTGRQRRAPEVGAPFRPYGAPELVLGTASVVEEPHRLVLDLAEDVAGDTLSLRLGDGTGHGARIHLEVAGAGEDLDAALELWGEGALGGLARAAAGRA